MHHDGVRRRRLQQLRIQLITRQHIVALPSGSLVVAHRDPSIGHHAARAGDGLKRIIGQLNARTLAARPQLVLADEPTGNLDQATGDAVLDLMLRLVAETGAALLMVTHSPRLANRLDRRVTLSAGRIT
jgi:ABC-type transport system involved in cytochrome bd biosynthesis fused ATPase/permease subunit